MGTDLLAEDNEGNQGKKQEDLIGRERLWSNWIRQPPDRY
jgi:hypothetical protein